MSEQLNISKKASGDIEKFLKSLPTTLAVINVEDNPKYQKEDVDLLLVSDKEETPKILKLEIKADTYYHTGNYFFEVISNCTKETEGCFMYTTADFIFYYFVEPMELHILPMPLTRDWFIENQHRFIRKFCTSHVYGDITYDTMGKLVPRRVVLEEVEGVIVIPLKEILE